jgi:anaphase-promoting complex subunit 6
MTARYRRLDDAQETYKKVLELDPRHSVALGFLGMVYHLKSDLDQAIIKYHEVSFYSTPNDTVSDFTSP